MCVKHTRRRACMHTTQSSNWFGKQICGRKIISAGEEGNPLFGRVGWSMLSSKPTKPTRHHHLRNHPANQTNKHKPRPSLIYKQSLGDQSTKPPAGYCWSGMRFCRLRSLVDLFWARTLPNVGAEKTQSNNQRVQAPSGGIGQAAGSPLLMFSTTCPLHTSAPGCTSFCPRWTHCSASRCSRAPALAAGWTARSVDSCFLITCRRVRVLAPTEVPKALATSLAPVPYPKPNAPGAKMGGWCFESKGLRYAGCPGGYDSRLYAMRISAWSTHLTCPSPPATHIVEARVQPLCFSAGGWASGCLPISLFLGCVCDALGWLCRAVMRRRRRRQGASKPRLECWYDLVFTRLFQSNDCLLLLLSAKISEPRNKKQRNSLVIFFAARSLRY